MKICPKCGRRYPEGERCSCSLKRKSDRYYDKFKRNKLANKIYHSTQWHHVAQYIYGVSNGRDLAAFYIFNRLVSGSIVHHVYTISEKPDLAYTTSNLILVGRKMHDYIHKAYRANEASKKAMQDKLLHIISIRDHTGG